jgi:hypothetical protein
LEKFLSGDIRFIIDNTHNEDPAKKINEDLEAYCQIKQKGKKERDREIERQCDRET